jgi:hypothetical protein
MPNLEKRLTDLERFKGPAEYEFVARQLPDGSLVADHGGTLAPHFAVLPRVCKTTAEWLKKYAPQVDERPRQ